MAIYTNYGRYLKAKYFKDLLESDNSSIYMLLGIGSPSWDMSNETGNASENIPLAPYNTDSILNPSDQASNPFYNNKSFQVFTKNNHDVDTTVENGEPRGPYIHNVNTLQPPFPCLTIDSTPTILFSINGFIVTTANFYNYYIKDGSLYKILSSEDTSSEDILVGDIDFPNDSTYEDSVKRQYYAEMYLRGNAMSKNIFAPVGLLGAVKCDISFVRDIGNDYTGEPNQLWYGDRYWEIVDPPDEINSYLNHDKGIDNYPHHLLFNTLITPRRLCNELNIDRNIVPRQLAIFTCADKKVSSENYLRADDYVFNFGQYCKISEESSDWRPIYTSDYDSSSNKITGTISDDNTHAPIEVSRDDGTKPRAVIDFTIKCNIKHSSSNDVACYYPGSEFKFLLNDYIRGAVRNNHSADRFGYIVGF